ncbi:triose-phosphate isomerase [Candidatus Falkowbacteria bacterium]|jgi:triosephosphate isomerase (TIM)|nr:triose-phosphate isomerase [Candidatus Falkowbacteria bacterium]
MKKLLIANWKMYLKEKQTLDLIKKYKERLKKFSQLEIVVAPSDLYLIKSAELLKKTKLKLAAQNIAQIEEGALTGEVSAEMAHEIGCKYTIVGHSERRIHLNETDDQINKKINLAYNNGLTPILCIGETLKDKVDENRDTVLTVQLRNALSKVNGLPEKELLIAYEPVWAIGTGKTMEAEEMLTINRLIKRIISSLYSESFYENKVKLLYGGSINSINAKEFWLNEVVDGLLVGSASIDNEQTYNIAHSSL